MRFAQERALGRKVSDEFTVPLSAAIIARARVGPAIARAVHSPERSCCDQSLRGILAQGSQQTLHDRMLLLAELTGMEFGETVDDGNGGKLWLGRQPALDQRNMRVEL
jgi:hypothetical protein